ncbi:SDR family oxidoreductase [Parasediminibacterium sp. JCM 36343]|uniref:SDR family oxidoreductase n=1 Tax=Parasediminibacterium sp. JCM 36343 TaxID=3374279 RepID=UPI00397E04D6
MKVLVTGSNGFLGQHLTDYFAQKGLSVSAISRGQNQNNLTEKLNFLSLDLTHKEAVIAAIATIKPDVIVHNAAMSKPDDCHNNQALCIEQNLMATSYLLEAAEATRPYFLYVSTDFIYGEDGPHSEDAVPNPLNFYGESKLMAEELVKKSGLLYGIMRPVFIYGPSYGTMKPTFLHWVKNNLAQQKQIKVVTDQQRTPTYVYDICKGVYAMIMQKINTDINLAGKDILSPYEMAIMVAETLQLDKNLIEPVTSDTFPEIVKRAKRSGLTIGKARELLGYEPISFEEGVKITFDY